MAAGGAMAAFPKTSSGASRMSAPSFFSSRKKSVPELTEATVDSLQRAMQAGALTSAALCAAYLKRIAALDRRGPALRAVLEINPDALSIARALDEERRRSGPRGPLHGIPVLIKDNIDTHDRMMTTAGSLALLGSIAAQDAFIVQQMRQAGAVILGKTNLSEWANFRSNRSSSGWSARGGQTRNPYALDRSPCGSSSGSGVAVAAGLCALAVGTETDGSIVCPSSMNGVVGIKPTLGLVSRTGIIPIAASQDTAGPMTRTVADAAILLSVLTRSDPADPKTASAGKANMSDYARALDPNGLKGARLGVVRRFFGFQEGVERLMDRALDVLKKQGAVLVDPAEMPSGGRAGSAEFEVMLYEFKDGLNKYLGQLPSDLPVHSLAELIEFNLRHKEREMPYFGQETLIQAQAKGPLTESAYLEALKTCHIRARVEGIDAVMNKHHLDALIAPTTGPAATMDLLYGNHGRGGCSSPAAVAGYPHVTVPAGYVQGLPVGLSFFGRAYSDLTMIKFAYAFEQATHHRRAPEFKAAISLT
jgi:amidase